MIPIREYERMVRYQEQYRDSSGNIQLPNKNIIMLEWKQYKRKGLSEMRRIVFGENLKGVSISDLAKKLMEEFPNVFAEGYIARNPKNHEDMWYVAKKYFDDNLEPV